MKDKYDLIVLGSGPAGHIASIRGSERGLNVAVIDLDDDHIGGVCLNEGCIPAKSLFASAGSYVKARSYAESSGDVAAISAPDIGDFISRAEGHTEKLKKGLKFLLKKNNVDIIEGIGRLVSPTSVQVDKNGNKSTISGGDLLVAVGSRPANATLLEIDGKSIITSTEAIRLRSVPDSILIVGAGAIGMEMASYFSSLGCAVTVVEARDTILPNEDAEASARLTSIYKRRGMVIMPSTIVTRGKVYGGKVKVDLDHGGREEEIICEKVLISTGREPNTDGMGLDVAGVDLDESGFIKVDGNMRTSAPNVYAAGDCTGGMMLAHSASMEAEIAIAAICGDTSGARDHLSVPNAVYTDIEIASVGLTETVARETVKDVFVGKTFFLSNGKAVAGGNTEGFVKVIASGDGNILGAHIVGVRASDLIHEFVLARKYGLTVKDIAETVHAHPTLSEAIPEACRAASAATGKS